MEVSEEINACSIEITVNTNQGDEQWLLMFKNETHNHPTEIEPFGGAATCLGGAIRDPLSGRAYVYQSMRITGAGDPRKTLAETTPGKLPQRKICQEAAHGFSSYGNQIGLTTGYVHEIYYEGYIAKRMEVGAVVAAAPKEQVKRLEPQNGQIVLLIGGRTGRDGIGGATGSSKSHDVKSIETMFGKAITEPWEQLCVVMGLYLPLRGEKSRNAVLYCMKRKQGKLGKYRFRILTMWVHCAQLW